MSRRGGDSRALPADKVEDPGPLGPSLVSREEVPVDPGLGSVFDAREGVEVESEEALPVLRAEGVGEQESQELSFVVRRASKGPETTEGRHG